MPTLGPYTLHTIETGRFGLDGGAMFGIVPKPLWEQKIPPDDQNRIPLNMRCLLLRSDEHVALIDSGIGTSFGEKFGRIYAVDHEYAELHASLEAAGVTAADVTDVILTHLHFDHCGGCTRRGEDGMELVFPNARHIVQQDHWAWATDPNDREQGSFLDQNLQPLADSDQLHLVEGPTEVLPGVEVIPVHGHTEAQQMVKISDNRGNCLVFVADLLPTTAHLPAAWIMAYDVRPLATLDEKKRFLNDAAAKGWDLFFEHDPEVAVANVKATDRGFTAVDPRPLSELHAA